MDIQLEEREYKEIALALVYSKYFTHGTAGHNRLMLLAKLAEGIGFEIVLTNFALVLFMGKKSVWKAGN